MADEGVFPKAAGDYLFASEVNRFASAPRYLFGGSTAWIPSGTGNQELGSVVVGAGSLTNPAYIEVNFKGFKIAGATYNLFVSGIDGNQRTSIGNVINSASHGGRWSIFIGSGMKGHVHGQVLNRGGDNMDNTNIGFGAQEYNSIDPANELALIFEVGAQNGGSASLVNYNVQSYRSSL